MVSNRWIWKETAEVIGVLGVVGGLIIVALEIRQNTDATLSAAVQAVAQQSIDINTLMVENADLRAAVISARDEGGLDVLDEDQRTQLQSFFSAVMRVQQNRFELIQLSIFDDEDVYSTRLGSGYCQAPFALDWVERRNDYSQEFVEWFDEELRHCEE